MTQIDIKVNSVKSTNNRLKSISSSLSDTQDRISNLRYSIDSSITQRRGIGASLSTTASSIKQLEKRIEQLQLFIDDSVQRYEAADKKVNSQKLDKPEKKSFWDKFKDAVSAVGNFVKGLGTGIVDAFISTLEGIWNVITHPIETVKGFVHVVSHPIETAKSIWESIKNSWNNDVVNGDAESRGNWFGRAFGEIALAIVGTKGVDKAVKLTKGAKVVDEVGGFKIDLDTGNSHKDIPGESKGPNGISPSDAAKLENWKYPPSEHLYLKYKEVYDNPKYYNQETGDINWPGTKGDPNIDGFKNGKYEVDTLKPGTEIDRYGNNNNGQYFSPAGSSYESRALPPHMQEQTYTKYTVIREFDVRTGEIAPWFDEVGGGIQHYSKIEIMDDFGNPVPATVENLLKYGYIKIDKG